MKYVIITGASQGLGLELVKKCIEKKYKVFALSRRISQELSVCVSENCIAYECDITDFYRLQKVKLEIEKYTDIIDILFNNAGVWLEKEKFLLDDENFDFDLILRQYEVNAIGAIKVIKTFLDMILKSETKCIINVSSEAGSISNCVRKCEYGYCMSKAALNMATKILSNAYSDIRFYAVHPGWMKTPQGYASVKGKDFPPEAPNKIAEKLIQLAEDRERKNLYIDFNGKCLNW